MTTTSLGNSQAFKNNQQSQMGKQTGFQLTSLLREVVKGIFFALTISLVIGIIVLVYFVGLVQGYNFGKSDAEIKFIELVNDKLAEKRREAFNFSPTPSPTPIPTPVIVKPVLWGGPELWGLVNKRRKELGVNALGQKDELCTIASLRLNELLELGKLDGHAGFGNLKERRPDLKWIFDEFSVVAEFLASGGETAQTTVNLWENTLGHKKIVDGGEFVWGCIYAQESFAVGILAY